MFIDVDGLKDKVKPQIKNTRKYLELGKSSIKSISVPSDFSYSTRLRNIPQNILEIDNKINIIEKWIDTTISNFTTAETKNKSLMSDLISAIPTSSMGGKVVASGGSAVSILDSNDFIDEIKSSVKGAFDYVFSGEWFTDAVDMGKKTAAKIGDKIESAISWAWTTGAEIKEKVTNCVSNKIESGLEFVGSKISEGWEFTYQNIITPCWNFLKATGASIANAVIGVVKGLCQLIESLLDFIVMLVTGVGSIFTGAYDGISYLVAMANGDTEDWSSATGAMWKGVMGYVAEDHVGSAFKSFYSDTVVGQWLDENAIDIFKSDGIGTNIASGIGYVAGIIVLTIATLRNRYSGYRCCNPICNNCFSYYSYCGWNW